MVTTVPLTLLTLAKLVRRLSYTRCCARLVDCRLSLRGRRPGRDVRLLHSRDGGPDEGVRFIDVGRGGHALVAPQLRSTRPCAGSMAGIIAGVQVAREVKAPAAPVSLLSAQPTVVQAFRPSLGGPVCTTSNGNRCRAPFKVRLQRPQSRENAVVHRRDDPLRQGCGIAAGEDLMIDHDLEGHHALRHVVVFDAQHHQRLPIVALGDDHRGREWSGRGAGARSRSSAARARGARRRRRRSPRVRAARHRAAGSPLHHEWRVLRCARRASRKSARAAARRRARRRRSPAPESSGSVSRREYRTIDRP